MDDRLRKLKKSMKRTIFNDLTFTNDHKEQIKSKISTMKIKSDDEILIAVLHLLIHEKTGFELNKCLRARGIENFEDNEGYLYMLLHRLEHAHYLQTVWKENDEKYYALTDKGKKLVAQSNKKQFKSLSVVKGLMEG
jgi:DNA-binding PadR family transcriptional regulator